MVSVSLELTLSFCARYAIIRRSVRPFVDNERYLFSFVRHIKFDYAVCRRLDDNILIALAQSMAARDLPLTLGLMT